MLLMLTRRYTLPLPLSYGAKREQLCRTLQYTRVRVMRASRARVCVAEAAAARAARRARLPRHAFR